MSVCDMAGMNVSIVHSCYMYSSAMQLYVARRAEVH
eukprot:SAG31_NODE_1823_length_7191_cov_9.623519_2_plen_36_part_00